MSLPSPFSFSAHMLTSPAWPRAADGEDRVFGQPLRTSLKYASVAISMAGEDGQQYVWGYVPVIVAKIGLYLKENGECSLLRAYNVLRLRLPQSRGSRERGRSSHELCIRTATEVEGVFRIAGSQKRMRELQETFDTPPRVSQALRRRFPPPCPAHAFMHTVRQERRLDQVQRSRCCLRAQALPEPNAGECSPPTSLLCLPSHAPLAHKQEPIVPLHLYNEFRAPMVKDPLDLEAATRTYRLLITSCPPANQYLLLYVLDLLAVFARKCETNLMTPSSE